LRDPAVARRMSHGVPLVSASPDCPARTRGTRNESSTDQPRAALAAQAAGTGPVSGPDAEGSRPPGLTRL